MVKIIDESGQAGKMRYVFAAMRVLLFCVAVAVLVSVHAQNIPMDKQAFTAYVEKQMHKKLEGVSIKAEDEPLTLLIDVYHISLDHIYLVCQQGANKCAAQVQHFINAVAETVNTKKVTLGIKDLRLALRSEQYMQQLGQAADYLQKRPFIDGLVILAVSDASDSIQPVNSADLSSMKLTSAEMFELASNNTRTALPPMAEVAKPARPGKIETTGFETYAPSRLLFFEQWSDLAKQQDGVLLVCAPTTSRILFISESSTVAVGKLRAAARDLMSNSPGPLSDTILKWTPAGWEVLS